MTEEIFGLGDPAIRRLQQAFAHEEPAIELGEVRRRAARYRPAPGHGLTAPEVAETLGKTTGAVKALQHRGLASLARVLDGLRSPHETQKRPYLSPDPARLTSQEEEER